MFANMEAFKTSIQNARDNVKEFSRIGVNNAKTVEQVSRYYYNNCLPIANKFEGRN
jgi:hypothetical protein